MPTKRMTLLEIDTLLQSIEAKQISAVETVDKGTLLLGKRQTQLTLGHLSDERTGLHVRESRYSANELKEFYPVSPEAATNTTTVLNVSANLTAGIPAISAQPAAGRVHEIEFIYAQGSGAFAANRQMRAVIFDGTNELPIYESGIAALVGTEAGLIFPTDEFTAVAVYPGSRNSFDTWNGSYLRFIATGLAAAEEIQITIHWKVKDAGGLRR